MYNDTYEEVPSHRHPRADVGPSKPLPMMLDSHGNPIRVSTSQFRKVKGGYKVVDPVDLRQAQQYQKQQRRASGIPQRVQQKDVRQERPVKKVNMAAPRTQPQLLPSTPDTIHSRLSGASSSRTVSVRRSPTTYWRGLPYMRGLFVQYAKAKGWAVRAGAARLIDEEETWCSVKDNFLEETGVRISMHELGRPLPILAFYSNRDIDSITHKQQLHIRRFLQEMGYAKDFPLVWYSKKG